MTGQPLVSIITACYNSAEFIEDCIISILDQTYENWELIITDDCSTDKSIELVEKFVKIDSRIKLFKLRENQGAGVARNNSIKNARGRFIAFCDSDDKWLKFKLETQIMFMIDNNLDFSYSAYNIISHDNKFLRKKTVDEFVNFKSLLTKNCIGCLTVVYDTSRIGKLLMPVIRKRQDWAMWLDIHKKKISSRGLLMPLAEYRIRDDSISRKKLHLIKYNYSVYRNHLKFSHIKSFYWIIIFLIKYTYEKIKNIF